MKNLNNKPKFYIRFDYRAVYLAYWSNEENKFLERHFTPSGIEIYERVRDYIKNTFDLQVGRWTIETIMFYIGTDTPNSNSSTIVKGRNLSSGLPDQIKLTREQVQDVLTPLLEGLVFQINYNWRNFVLPGYQKKVEETGFLIIKGDFPLPADFAKLLENALSVPVINSILEDD